MTNPWPSPSLLKKYAFIVPVVLALASSSALAQQLGEDRSAQAPRISTLAQGDALPARSLEAKVSQIRGRGKVDLEALEAARLNPHVRPYWSRFVVALDKVDGLPGVNEVVRRLAQGRTEGNARGAAFEVIAGAALGPKLRQLSTMIKGNECDALLKDGTVVSMKSIASLSKGAIRRTMHHATKQLERRSPDGKHVMIVVGHEPEVQVKYNWPQMAAQIGAPLTVLAMNHKTGALQRLFSSTGSTEQLKVRSKLYESKPSPAKEFKQVKYFAPKLHEPRSARTRFRLAVHGDPPPLHTPVTVHSTLHF